MTQKEPPQLDPNTLDAASWGTLDQWCMYSVLPKDTDPADAMKIAQECAAKGCPHCKEGLEQVGATLPQEPVQQKPTKYYRAHVLLTFAAVEGMVDDSPTGGRILNAIKQVLPANVYDYVFQLQDFPNESSVRVMGTRDEGPHVWWNNLIYAFRADPMLQRKLHLTITQNAELVALRKRHLSERSALSMEEQLNANTSTMSDEDREKLKTEFLDHMGGPGTPDEEKLRVFVRWLDRAGFVIIPR